MRFELLIVAVIVVHQLALLWRAKGDYNPFRAEVIVDAFLLGYFGWGVYQNPYTAQEFSEKWDYAIIVLVGIAALYSGMHVPLVRIPEPVQRNRELILNPKLVWVFFAMHVMLATILLDLNASLSGTSLLGYLTGGRIGGYLRGQLFEGGMFYQGMTMTLAPSLMLLAIYLRRRDWPKALGIYGLLVYSALAVFRTRLGLIILLMVPGYYLYRRFSEARLRLIILPLLLGIFIAMMGVLQMWRYAGVQALTTRNVSLEFTTVSNLEGVGNTTLAFRWLVEQHIAGTLQYEKGVNYWYCLVSFVPRRFWPEKPITAFEPRWTEYFLNRRVGSGIPIWTFTAWGEGLAQFGLLGVALNLFLYGLLIQAAQRILGYNITTIAAFQYAVIAGSFLRGSFQALFVYSLLYVVPAYLCLRFCFAPVKQSQGAAASASTGTASRALVPVQHGK